MSHLRDIQRLRQNRNLEPIITSNYNSQNRAHDIYNINFDKIS